MTFLQIVRQTLRVCPEGKPVPTFPDHALAPTMGDRLVACCPCFETLASLAPQHEVVVFQQVKPHPEEAANGSRECAPDDRLRGRLEGWAAIPICDSRY